MSNVIKEKTDQRSVEEAILETVRGLRYGSVEITVHNAQVVQIERREKLRFTQQ